MLADSYSAPRCKLCGHEMYMTRFLADVSGSGIDREHHYECLWCGESDTIGIPRTPRGPVEQVAA
jgi:hypothetical protein